jgi:molecular chaperone GrpE (heat shock protein)
MKHAKHLTADEAKRVNWLATEIQEYRKAMKRRQAEIRLISERARMRARRLKGE